MEDYAYAAFFTHLAVVLAGGGLAVLSTSLVRALVGLILTFFGVAGMYLLMAAPFLALMQLLIYLGAVVVLIFFAIMLTRAPGGSAGHEGEGRGGRRLFLAGLTALLPALVLGRLILAKAPPSLAMPQTADLPAVGAALLGPWALVFELISVALFVAMAGAALIGWERRRAWTGAKS